MSCAQAWQWVQRLKQLHSRLQTRLQQVQHWEGVQLQHERRLQLELLPCQTPPQPEQQQPGGQGRQGQHRLHRQCPPPKPSMAARMTPTRCTQRRTAAQQGSTIKRSVGSTTHRPPT